MGGIALHWFYSEVRVIHVDRIPLNGPLLIAVNHQNALIDAIVAQWVVPRELRITAKATLAQGISGRLLVRVAGIIPLQRSSDVSGPASAGPVRNRTSFVRMIDILRAGGAILVFPEGKSHNEPNVAPLKTGLARAALRARESGVHGITIVPIGLSFESKSEPGTVVLAQVGEPIRVDKWPGDDAHQLTRAVAENLRAVSLVPNVHHVDEVPQHHTVLVRFLAWWGRINHVIPVRLARRLALRVSRDEGEPAMYTITFGVGLVLLAYLVQVSIVYMLLGRVVAALYLVSLIEGAYWVAYIGHR